MSMVLKVNGASDNELLFLKKTTAKIGASEIKGHFTKYNRTGAGVYFCSETDSTLVSFYLWNGYT